MSRFAKRRVLLVWGAAALAGAAVSLIVELGSHHERPGGFEIAVDLVVGLSFAATGLIAWARRPENNTGRLLLVVSFTWFLGLLGSANDAVVSTIGFASGALVLAAFVHLVLAYPAGRLPTRADRAIVVSGYALAVVANVLTLMFEPHPECSKCATNVLLVANKPAVGRAVDTGTNVSAAILVAIVVAMLVVRYRAATPVARRMLRPIGVAGGTALTFLAASFAAGPINRGVKDVLATIALITLTSVPFWFLAGLLRSRLARGGVAQLLLDVRETASLDEAQDGLRRALNDAGVMLAAWVEERQGYVDPDGRAFEVPTDDVDRIATMVGSETGEPVAVIVHDRALLDEPELLEAVAVAARLALHRNRLQAELRARLDELQRERDFMRDVVNAAPAFFCVVDLQGRIIRFNDTMARATGVMDDDATRGRFVWEVFAAPEDAAGFRECVIANVSGEEQHRFHAADGSSIDVAWSLTPVKDSQGVLRLVLTGADVSERVRHAEELRRERDFLDLVGHSTPTLLCVVDPNGVVTERGVNTAFEVATGVGDDAAIGHPFWELVVPEDEIEGARSEFFAAVEAGCSTRTETPWRAADGRARFCNSCGAALATTAPPREVRKTVTVLFCDVTGSTELGESTDPEALRALLARYFERMRTIVESHGGTVEKFIGDAVMAVFGVPLVHEDDALRACRAAVEMRDALPQLGIRGRIGVNTGEVVTGTEERLATGDAVNVAARFEQAAQPGEVLIGEGTHALVRGAVVAEPVEPLELKGKAERVPALRLVSVLEAPERSHASRFIGREGELAELAEAWKRAQAQSSCELVTVVGDAGVGKSRLVAEALAAVESRAVRGRCLPYGEGITYWPVVEVVKQLAAVPSDPAAATAIQSLLGESAVATSGDEIAWAFRKLLEEHAPLVVVFDDLQWGDETFLNLIESTALLSAGAPLLLLCIARPDLLERRPSWPAALRLEPLPAEQAEELIGDQVSDELRGRITRAAGGNPLFISEMLAMAADDAGVEVPPTLKALLAARLDQLDEAERKVLERGAVEGEIFHRGAVQALAPEEAQVTTRLAGLVRRELIRPDRAQLAGDDGYRFRHLLIRDAAYDALPKAVRADLHARFADWLDRHGQALVELDEIVGYHLEQATRYLTELGRPDSVVAERAAARLAAAGRRAVDRQDSRTAASLLTRAAELVRPTRLDLALELEAAWTLGDQDPRAAAQAAEAAAIRAEAEGDPSGAMLARALSLFAHTASGEHVTTDEEEELLRAALPFEEQRSDPRRLALLWELRAFIANFRMRNEDDFDASTRALHYHRLAGDFPSDTNVEWALIIGPRPADEAMWMLDELAAGRPVGAMDLPRAALLAMLGRFDEAWPLAEARSNHLREVTGDSFVDAGSGYLSLIATIEGDRERARRHNAELVEGARHGSVAASFKTMLARDLCYLGRCEEAEPLLRRAQAVPPRASVRVMGPAVEALLLAERGELEHAVTLARTAVATGEAETDSPWIQGWAYEDLVTVLMRAGRIDETRDALERSLALWERKGCLPCAARVRAQLDALGRAKV